MYKHFALLKGSKLACWVIQGEKKLPLRRWWFCCRGRGLPAAKAQSGDVKCVHTSLNAECRETSPKEAHHQISHKWIQNECSDGLQPLWCMEGHIGTKGSHYFLMEQYCMHDQFLLAEWLWVLPDTIWYLWLVLPRAKQGVLNFPMDRFRNARDQTVTCISPLPISHRVHIVSYTSSGMNSCNRACPPPRLRTTLEEYYWGYSICWWSCFCVDSLSCVNLPELLLWNCTCS